MHQDPSRHYTGTSMFTYLGRSKIVLANGMAKHQVDAILWQENPRGGGAQRNFFVRPLEKDRYHLRIIVGNVTTTDRDSVGRGEVSRAAKLMGIYVQDAHWSDVDSLR